MRFGKFWRFAARYDAPDADFVSRLEDLDGVVGAAFFEEYARAHGYEILDVPDGAGIVPDFSALASSTFDPDLVDPAVRAIYEHTTTMSFLGASMDWTWHGWIRHVVWGAVLGWQVQSDFPLDAGFFPRRMTSRLVPIDHDADGVADELGWVRTFERSERVFYSAAVRVIRRERDGTVETYLVFTLPIWNASFTVVFAPQNWTDGGFRIRSSVPGRNAAGMYLVFPGRDRYTMAPAFGLTDEIRLRPVTRGRGERVVLGSHIGTFMGLRSFELNYEIQPKDTVTRDLIRAAR